MLGLLYVYVGSALGGLHLLRVARTAPWWQPEREHVLLRPYGDHFNDRWRAVLGALERLDPDETNAAVVAARAGFDVHRRYLIDHLSVGDPMSDDSEACGRSSATRGATPCRSTRLTPSRPTDGSSHSTVAGRCVSHLSSNLAEPLAGILPTLHGDGSDGRGGRALLELPDAVTRFEPIDGWRAEMPWLTSDPVVVTAHSTSDHYVLEIECDVPAVAPDPTAMIAELLAAPSWQEFAEKTVRHSGRCSATRAPWPTRSIPTITVR